MGDKRFFDEVDVYMQAGNGGDGCCSFRREKFIPKGGPDGGNGGNGGDIELIARGNLNTLLFFHYNVHHIAENGKNGSGKNMTGASGLKKELFAPIGTQILDRSGKILLADLNNEGDKYIVVHGGAGGIGNMAFKTSINQAPRQVTKGEIGESGWFKLRLKMLSDVGLVGLPNVGKSSIISALTNAKAKIGNYSFTTTKPMLGVIKRGRGSIVMCDIPGIIYNAHKGAGLGDKFLKHIERCKILLFVLDASSEHILEDYKTIKNEIKQYNKNILKKDIIVAFNKIDLVDDLKLKNEVSQFKKATKIKPICISTISHFGLNDLVKLLFNMCKNG